MASDKYKLENLTIRLLNKNEIVIDLPFDNTDHPVGSIFLQGKSVGYDPTQFLETRDKAGPRLSSYQEYEEVMTLEDLRACLVEYMERKERSIDGNWHILLTDFDRKKPSNAIKAVRLVTGYSLSHAKMIVDDLRDGAIDEVDIWSGPDTSVCVLMSNLLEENYCKYDVIKPKTYWKFNSGKEERWVKT